MQLHEVLTTTPATREFTDDPVDDATIYRILDLARFAPNGGNRQAWHVLVVRGQAGRRALAEACDPTARRYAAQGAAGEMPFNTIHPTALDDATVAATDIPAALVDPYRAAPVVLVVCLDLSLVASIDAELDRVGIVSGGSVYPFAWSLLLAARAEGLGGVLTTMPIAREPDLRKALGIPDHVAVAAVVPLGRPARRITRLGRGPVEDFARHERWDGPALRPS